eukprot:jgi/Mesen1/2210/ME000152S01291
MALTCKICFESAQQQGARARVTICGHVFCEACAAGWFQTEITCPVAQEDNTCLLKRLHEQAPPALLPPCGGTCLPFRSSSFSLNSRVDHLEVDGDGQLARMSVRNAAAALLPGGSGGRASSPGGARLGAGLGRGGARPPREVEERLRAATWQLAETHTIHRDPVHGIAVSPAGDLVATASWDHVCRLYDVASSREVGRLEGHALGLYAVRFSPAQQNLMGTVSSDQTCRLWSAATRKCLKVLEGHTDEVNGLSFQQGSSLVATASDDMTGIIWDAERGSPITMLQGHQSVVYGVCFQPQGPLVATASFDWTARLWDPRTGGSVQTLQGHQEDVIGVDMDHTGHLLATGSDDATCRLWDVRMGQPLVVLREHAGEVKRVAFSPYGALLATTSGDATVRLFCMATFECLHVLSSHSDHVFDVAWSPTAEFVVTASHDKQWKLWRPKTGAPGCPQNSGSSPSTSKQLP